jgi:protein involved in polysaccharide export with SLBB domain
MYRPVLGIATVAFGASLVLAGCSSIPRPYMVETPPGAQIPLGAVPAARATGAQAASLPAYHMRAGDQLKIRFLFHKELDSAGTIREDGRISVPGLGDFLAAGVSTEQLEGDLYRRASLTYRDPQVTVVVERPTDFRAYVGGEVRRPGFVPLHDGLTSLRAIFESGGFMDTAKVDHVLHVRWDDQGAFSARVINLKRALETGDMREDIALGPNDVVFVPKTAVANADLWVKQYLIDLIPLREPTTRIDDFR